MNIVVSDPKSGKAFSKKTEEAVFLNRAIGEEVDLGVIGMAGYKAKIVGGSDKQGFPMKKSLDGPGRKKLLLKKGVGFKTDRKGKRKRRSVRGNTVSPEIMQLNIVITKAGDKKFEDFMKADVEKPKEEDVGSAKDRLVKQSLENVGNVELAGDAKLAKGKVRK
ncbi:MAG: 30S ribosomal protein S6e [archaeon]|jgi:small subunit ribosomal protein S6e|nr:30S ribosomal protein S6e [archaeon]